MSTPISNRSQTHILRALADSDSNRASEGTSLWLRPCTICISRDHGAGGEEIARQLAQTLGIHMYDKELLDLALRDPAATPSLLEGLDKEPLQTTEWQIAQIKHGSSTQARYWRDLAHVLLGIARKGGIIMGRGANFLLPAGKAFRVRIVGSPERCRDRIAAADGVTPGEAEARVKSVNTQRRDFIRDIFGFDINDPHHFDVLLNTDRITAEQAARIVISAMCECGFHVPKQSGPEGAAPVPNE